MSRGVNKVILIGNLGQDPEMRYIESGTAVANVSIATSESWNDKNTGEKVEKTEWHRVVFWGKLAEIVGEWLKKGSQVYIEGSLQTRKWQDADGNDRYTTEVKASNMQMLGGKQDAQSGQSNAQSGYRNQKNPTYPEAATPKQQTIPVDAGGFDDDDIPF